MISPIAVGNGCTPESDRPAPQSPAGGQAVDAPNNPVVLSFFSGALGLDLGLEEAGLAPRLGCETDPDARATIRANRPGLPLLNDIHECTAARVRAAAGIGDADIDLACGGAPCQSFSTAGSRRALDDPRGIALLKFASLAVELKPKYVVLENVRGLLSAGGALEKLLGMLRDAGYAISFSLYNAAYFGAPQHRERLVIVGSRNGCRLPYLTPSHSDRPADGLPPWRTLRDAIGDMAAIEHHYVEFPEKRLAFFRKLKPGQDWRHLSAEDQKAALSEAARDAAGGKTGFYRRLAWDKPCPTLVSLPNMPATDLCHPEELRPLSVEEYKRIQGFPDHWRVCGNVESQYRQIGNAVPTLLGEAIGRTILEHMRARRSEDPVPGFRYSRYKRSNDRNWCGGARAAQARSAEPAPEIRRAGKRTKGSPPVALRNFSATMPSTTPWNKSRVMSARIAIGDARRKLKSCPDDFFNTFVTSGPYWLKRDYHAGPEEIGREPTMREYVDNMMRVIDEVYRTLAPHGTFWLNLGDSYVTGEAAAGSGGLPDKSLCLLPYRIAIAMEDRGWIVRNVIIWWKPNFTPESADDRFTVDYEPVFLCTKSGQYYFKQQRQEYAESTLKRCQSFVANGEAFDPSRHKFDPDRPDQSKMKILERFAKGLVVPERTAGSTRRDRADGHDQDMSGPAGANRRCVLRIPTAGYPGLHFAPMPEELVELCLDAGCPPGGRVCDPFLGSGTTGVVARRRGCEFWGIELNPEYAQLARERIKAEGNVSVPAVDGGVIVGEELGHECLGEPQERLQDNCLRTDGT